jgi:multidrug efflux pump subunit AcrA (membrane-fusion protein)
MTRIFLLPLLALCGVLFAAWTVAKSNRPVPVAQPVAQPATAKFTSFVAGAGLIEPSSEMIAIGTPLAGIVVDVPVTVGSQVKAGDILFRLDDRALRAQLVGDEAAVAAAKAQRDRLAAAPRSEDLPVVAATVAAAKAATADAQQQLALAESVTVTGAISVDDLSRRRFALQAAQARQAQAQAELARLQAGTWAPDLAVAAAQLAQAEAKAAATRVELERLVIRAPRAAEVLQVRIRAGEFAPAGVTAVPLMLLGDTSTLHVRIDIDENDAWRLKPGAPAECYVRGNNRLHTALRYVRREPYVVPKRSLTGDSAERVDTRVLQVIYAFSPTDLPVHVGQQVDAFVETPAEATSAVPTTVPAAAAGTAP